MEIKDIVMKLMGPIDPIGETREDDIRFENLKSLCGLIDSLAAEVGQVCRNKNAHEYSRNRAGTYSDRFMHQTFKEY